MCPLTGKFVQGTKELKHFFWKKRTVSTNLEKNTFKLFYTVSFMLFTLFNDCQFLWLLLFYYLPELLRLVMLFITVTCFTLWSIKSWCATAVESVHLVCAGPVVFTGMTCTIIDICFKEKPWKLITELDRTCNNNNKNKK